MKLATFVSAAVAATTLAGCGDSLFTAQDRGDSVLNVRGQALSAAGESAPATDYDVGVLFMRHVWNWTNVSEYYLDVEFVKGTLTGNFPADFQVELTPPAETYPHNGISLYESWDGGLGLETFSGNQDDAPKGLRIGHLVVGPKAELAALPRRIDIRPGTPPFDLTFGALLKPYLPKSTVTSYQVLYADGVTPRTRMYRFARAGSHSDGIEVEQGYTLLDASTFTRSVQWSECAKSKREEALTTPLYDRCIADNAPYEACYDACIRDYSTPEDRIACYSVCDRTYPEGAPDYVCLRRAIRPLAEAACGPEAKPDLAKLKVLSPIDSLSVRLGEDDVKTGLWVLHSTIFNRGN
jgi:hypothetical protein